MIQTEKMSPYLSDKLKVLSFISIVFVVYIHTFYAEGQSFAHLTFVEDVVGNGIARMAVPLFYLISGYLLFLNLDSFSSCWKKMTKRVRTLLVPYLLTNTLAFLFFAFFDLISRMVPQMGGGNELPCFGELSGWSGRSCFQYLLASDCLSTLVCEGYADFALFPSFVVPSCQIVDKK